MRAMTVAVLAAGAVGVWWFSQKRPAGQRNPLANFFAGFGARDGPAPPILAPAEPENAIDEYTRYVNSTIDATAATSDLIDNVAGAISNIWDMFPHEESGNAPSPSAEAPSSIFT